MPWSANRAMFVSCCFEGLRIMMMLILLSSSLFHFLVCAVAVIDDDLLFPHHPTHEHELHHQKTRRCSVGEVGVREEAIVCRGVRPHRDANDVSSPKI